MQLTNIERNARKQKKLQKKHETLKYANNVEHGYEKISEKEMEKRHWA